MQHIFGGPGRVVFAATAATKLVHFVVKCSFFVFHSHLRWLGSRVVSVLDSGAEGPGFKSQSRRCRVTVLSKLFIVPLFT